MDSKIAAVIAGAAATAPMSATMAALHNLLPGEPERPLPPREITENAAAAADMPQPGTGATLAAHFGYGAAAGAAYLPFAGKSGMHPAAEGALFGLAVWGGSYLGLMPATGLYRPATEEPAARNALMVTAHLVWGASLGLLFRQLTQDDGDQNDTMPRR
jgi:putative membrane protein